MSSQKTLRSGAHPIWAIPGGGAARSAKQSPATGCLSLSTTSDAQIITGCLAGDTEAWNILYDRYHGPLMATVRKMHGIVTKDVNFVEEIAARVWYSLVKDEYGLLLRFDVSRGTFRTYISLIAWAQTRQYIRAERRRRSREKTVSKPLDSDHSDHEEISAVDFEELFIANLTPAERQFFHQVLTPTERAAPLDETYSPENASQLRRRILIKFEGFLQRIA